MNKRPVPLIVGNWKSTPSTLDQGIKFIKQLEKKLSSGKLKLPKKSYCIAAPEIFIPSLVPLAKSGYVGAQTVNGVKEGQITGATFPTQLLSAGAAFSLVGHSEVRARGEKVEERAEKMNTALTSSLTTIFCLGERVRDKEGKYLEELENDVKHTLGNIGREYFKHLIVAYEPVWAIGASTPATPHECFEAVIAVRRALASLAGIDHAKKVSILYGGTVNKDNARNFIQEGGVDGLLIGRASQEVSSFVDIISACYTK